MKRQFALSVDFCEECKIPQTTKSPSKCQCWFTTAVAGVTRPLERLRGPMGPRVQASGYTEQELCFVLRSDCTTASASCLAAVSGRLLLTDQSYQSSPSMTGGTLQRAHCRASSLDVAKSLTVTGLESYCFYEGGVWQ